MSPGPPPTPALPLTLTVNQEVTWANRTAAPTLTCTHTQTHMYTHGHTSTLGPAHVCTPSPRSALDGCSCWWEATEGLGGGGGGGPLPCAGCRGEDRCQHQCEQDAGPQDSLQGCILRPTISGSPSLWHLRVGRVVARLGPGMPGCMWGGVGSLPCSVGCPALPQPPPHSLPCLPPPHLPSCEALKAMHPETVV